MEKIPKSLKRSFQLPENSEDRNVLPYPAGRECYEVAKNENDPRRFKLIFADGRKISIPYASLPIIILDSEKNLTLRTHGIEVLIRGRGLDIVEQMLSEERVTMIMESNLSVDDNQTDVFIENINAEGKLLG